MIGNQRIRLPHADQVPTGSWPRPGDGPAISGPPACRTDLHEAPEGIGALLRTSRTSAHLNDMCPRYHRSVNILVSRSRDDPKGRHSPRRAEAWPRGLPPTYSPDQADGRAVPIVMSAARHLNDHPARGRTPCPDSKRRACHPFAPARSPNSRLVDAPLSGGGRAQPHGLAPRMTGF